MADKTDDGSSARPFVPADAGLDELREAAGSCRGCDLYKRATQVVFGAGPARARVMLVGEQPGDQEDREGAPFVGPAGAILNRAMADAGLRREDVYLTNAVKHFKWEPRGKRRIHQTPRLSEMRACRPWIEAEVNAVSPQVIVCLGSTAARALMGPRFRVTKERGQILESPWARSLVATYHPSAILRANDPAERDALYQLLVHDLELAASYAARGSRAPARPRSGAPKRK